MMFLDCHLYRLYYFVYYSVFIPTSAKEHLKHLKEAIFSMKKEWEPQKVIPIWLQKWDVYIPSLNISLVTEPDTFW